ncbi:MAG: hypothetical protein KAS32_27395 [Candidatus Peribacteraceae bacterium]|nr:hypothetical protein [Candidatus Peribacteraceae bacterium]
MNKSKIKIGTVFYIRRPTKALIEANSLDIQKYDLNRTNENFFAFNKFHGQKGLCINGVLFPNVWFNTSVIFTNLPSSYVAPLHDKSVKGFDSVIITFIDKESVKIKKNINYLVGEHIRIPLFLLKKKELIIDLRQIPTKAHECIKEVVSTNPALLIGDRFNNTSPKTAIELLAYCRRYHIAGYEFKQDSRTNIDLGILLKLKPGMINSVYNTAIRQYNLYCSCGRETDYAYLTKHIKDHTGKKRPKYKYTYTCTRCKIKYEIVLENSIAIFKGIGKNKNKRLIDRYESALLTFDSRNRITRSPRPPRRNTTATGGIRESICNV